MKRSRWIKLKLLKETFVAYTIAWKNTAKLSVHYLYKLIHMLICDSIGERMAR